MRRLPPTAEYIAWIDADLTFTNPNWALTAINKLKSVDLLQLFSEADFIGRNGQVQYTTKSLMYYAVH